MKAKTIALALAAAGATATLAGLGAGQVAAAPAGVADGCYQVISPISVSPVQPTLGTKVGTAHVKNGSITVLGQRGTITATPTGGVARVAGVEATLTAKTIGEAGDRSTIYRISGVPGIGALTPCGK